MRLVLIGAVLALALAGCGKSGSSAPSNVDACAMIAPSQDLFGANGEAQSIAPLDAMAGVCHFRSADGRRGGDLIIYTAQSLHGSTAAAQFAHFTQSWAGMTTTPLARVASVADEAQIATDLPGYQTQIVLRKGDQVAAILAWSGDPAMTGEALARRMASAVAAKL